MANEAKYYVITFYADDENEYCLATKGRAVERAVRRYMNDREPGQRFILMEAVGEIDMDKRVPKEPKLPSLPKI